MHILELQSLQVHCFFVWNLLLEASPASTEVTPSVGLAGHPHFSKGFVC